MSRFDVRSGLALLLGVPGGLVLLLGGFVSISAVLRPDEVNSTLALVLGAPAVVLGGGVTLAAAAIWRSGRWRRG